MSPTKLASQPQSKQQVEKADVIDEEIYENDFEWKKENQS